MFDLMMAPEEKSEDNLINYNLFWGEHEFRNKVQHQHGKLSLWFGEKLGVRDSEYASDIQSKSKTFWGTFLDT